VEVPEQRTIDPEPESYEVFHPGRLIVTYLAPGEYDRTLSDSAVLSVVRHLSVPKNSELYKPVIALTKERDVLFNALSGGFEISLFKS